MRPSVHAPIQAFLQQQPIVRLTEEGPAAHADYIKAGVVPFLRQPDYRYYLMKPVARHRDRSPPAFQLCKGTRMHSPQGADWKDMRDGEAGDHPMESLIETALREGIEELGLRLPSIRRLYELGPYGFVSEATGKDKRMWLFAAEMAAADSFAAAADIEAGTAERDWLSLERFAIVGRPDHRYILRDIEERLKIDHEKEPP